ncbi:asparagine synthase (glutamine-hydrolyzing) [Leptolyngbya sp. 15MV]|nr:asparagine synthase (glutamine-hydrolyzing) [Leptolyngbya sp. 15MV]
MCGIVGVVTHRSATPSISDAALIAMRDALAHRGPDDAGIWRQGHAALAHRRLAVIDPDPRSNQPFLSPCGKHAIVYNGELYNDADLRRDLSALGVCFRATSDTETVLHALITWGDAALARFRGMFALAWVDLTADRLLLARDPLGIKPLVWTRVPTRHGVEIAFASEAHALAHHPAISLRPDLPTVSAYLTTIRLTLGERTLFDGVRTLTPGQTLAFDLSRPELPAAAREIPWPVPEPRQPLRSQVVASVEAHLRSDVPLCVMLSGGLDSSILAAIASARVPSLHTFASGDDASRASPDSDFAHARAVAAHVGSIHHEAPVTRDDFARLWPDMVARLGVPLSTPNETAIHTVARALRRMGMVVALSGEGADELFAGYDQPLEQALAYERTGQRTDADRGLFQLAASSWATLDAKAQILQPGQWRTLERDEQLRVFYQHEFERLAQAEISAGHRSDRARRKRQRRDDLWLRPGDLHAGNQGHALPDQRSVRGGADNGPDEVPV